MKTLHLAVRDRSGSIAYQPIGAAIVSAFVDEKPTASALRKGLLGLVCYQAYSPSEAVEAMQVLVELGDVDFDESDFEPQWFRSEQGIATIDLILGGARQRFTAAVRDELVELRRALVDARSRGCTFCLVETEPGETLPTEARGRRRRKKTPSTGPLTARCTRRRLARC
jgi:hypothetical protein